MKSVKLVVSFLYWLVPWLCFVAFIVLECVFLYTIFKLFHLF
jgi:hypothetical protein